ncbi:hypothetical protein D6V15_15350 [Vibrio cholerae]|nr:hypothetical protein [Vibrio cholerae]MVB86614.1 hypothetical protein [Vibrio cholerae]
MMNHKRLTVDLLSIFVVLVYMDSKHFHYILEPNSAYILLTPALVLPFISVFSRLIDIAHKKIRSNPVTINLKSNQYELNWGVDNTVIENVSISLKEAIGNHPKNLHETLRTMLVEASKKKPKLSLAPLVIVNIQIDLTELEKERLHQIVKETGASAVVLVDNENQIEDAQMSAKLPNLI